ncbi:MAG: substrate-binding domain-containing protein [Firmicutes bacterium]|nr:substrate-binding domain-containing protein [Bacillota bacterium]
MKKVVVALLFISLVYIACLFSGCINIFSSSMKVDQVTEYNGHFTVGGSSAGMMVFKPLADTFSSKYPGVTFEYRPGSKTSAALRQVNSESLDIAVYARELKPEEKSSKLRFDMVFIDPIAIVVNKNLPVDSLSAQQVKDIYSGKVVNWSQVGSIDAPIIVCDRSEDETSKIALRKFLLGNDLEITPHAVMLEKETDMINAVASTQYAIGYYSASKVESAGNSKMLKIDGAYPSVDNVRHGTYKIVRPIGVATLYQNETLKEFIKFLYSKEAKEIVIKNGGVPIESKK